MWYSVVLQYYTSYCMHYPLCHHCYGASVALENCNFAKYEAFGLNHELLQSFLSDP